MVIRALSLRTALVRASRVSSLALCAVAAACSYDLGAPRESAQLLRLPDGASVMCMLPSAPMDAGADVLEAGADVVDAGSDAADAAAEGGDAAPDGGSASCNSNLPDNNDVTCPRYPLVTAMRIAHFVTELSAPNVDFCIRRAGDPMNPNNRWIGPLLKRENYRSPTGTFVGMTMGQVTRYMPISPGEYVFRIVNGAGAADAVSCDTPVSGSPAEIPMTLPAEMMGAMPDLRRGYLTRFEEHRYHTVVFAGRSTAMSGSTPPSATVLSDRHEGCSAASASCNMMIRAFHAAPGIGGVSVKAADNLITLSNEVPYRYTSTSPLTRDCHEYSEVFGYGPGISGRDDPTLNILSGTSSLINNDIKLTSVLMSVYLIGRAEAMAGSPNALRGILCNDLSSPDGFFTRCRAMTRTGGDPCIRTPTAAECL